VRVFGRGCKYKE